MSVALRDENKGMTPVEPFGRPGTAPVWSKGAKQAVGTAINRHSKVWFTIADGVITEVYYPSIDTAACRDIRFLVTDGRSFFDEEGRDTASEIHHLDQKAPAFKVVNRARSGDWSITKHILTDPEANSLVVRAEFETRKGLEDELKLFVLFAPRLENSGYGNSGRCASYNGETFLLARRGSAAAALTSDAPFLRMSAGYSGFSDGWHDLEDNYGMDWAFERAEDGNIALMAEMTASEPFNLALGFGRDELEAALTARRSLERGLRLIEREYIKEWKGYIGGLENLGKGTRDKGRRFYASAMVLKTHEDKTHRGAIAPSLSIPWGETRTDAATGYRLMRPGWLARTGFGFLAMGDRETAVNVLAFLARNQKNDGSWPLLLNSHGAASNEKAPPEEAAMAVILAWRLRKAGVAGNEFYLTIKKAAASIVRQGPAPFEDARAEASPSGLAAEVAALVCAALWARESGEDTDAGYLFSEADAWNLKVEELTFKACGCAGGDVAGHYSNIFRDVPQRLTPESMVYGSPVYGARRPLAEWHGHGELLDASFIDLARFGVRLPEDPLVTGSVASMDAHLKYTSEMGIAFYRFSGDGYGEHDDGTPFDGKGIGRPWPLMTGRRAIYEAISGGDPEPYVESLASFANEGLMFPEQVWDGPDLRDKGLINGRATGSAAPLVEAHAEYLTLLRTIRDGKGFDLLPEVQKRYAREKTVLHMSEWKPTQRIRSARAADLVRVAAFEKGSLVWTADGWGTRHEDELTETGLGVHFIDFKPGSFKPGSRLTFTFHYADKDRWEGINYEIEIG